MKHKKMKPSGTFALRRSAIVLKPLLAVLAIAAAYPTSSFAAAGVAQFAAGDVTLKRGATDDKLTKGKNVESGDVIETGAAGHAQIRFSDGGLVSLQPGTLFNIKKYADENDPKKDGFFVDLFRGSMRAVTGLIGKRNHDNYQVTTQTATIGIRGSAFFAGYNPDGSLSVSTEQDEIVVCTNGGCTGLTVGESVRVTGNGEIPTRTNNRTSFPTEQPKQDPTAAANKTTEDGKSAVVAADVRVNQPPTTMPNLPDNPPPTGDPKINDTFSDLRSQFLTASDEYSSDAHRSTTTITDDVMVKAQWTYGSHTVTFANTGTTIGGKTGSMENNDFIGWGYWSQGRLTDTYDSSDYTKNGVHYLVGVPSTGPDLPNQGQASYSFAGGAVTSVNAGAGQITGASLNVNFSSSKFSSTINTQFGSISIPVVLQQGHGTLSSDGTVYGSHDDVFMKGFVSGHFASTAGLLFRYTNAPAVGTITGAATFNQSSSSGLGYPPPN